MTKLLLLMRKSCKNFKRSIKNNGVGFKRSIKNNVSDHEKTLTPNQEHFTAGHEKVTATDEKILNF